LSFKERDDVSVLLVTLFDYLFHIKKIH